jgi:hypothetical protein
VVFDVRLNEIVWSFRTHDVSPKEVEVEMDESAIWPELLQVVLKLWAEE